MFEPLTHTVNFTKSQPVNEMVLVIDRHELTKQSVGTNGIYPFTLNDVNPKAFGYLSREFADNKSATSIEIGKVLPQILGYFQITDPEGRILTYRRKGKEKGLLGKLSIGVGGHVDSLDGLFLGTTTHHHTNNGLSTHIYPYVRDTIGEVIRNGAERELFEEIGLMADLAKRISSEDGQFSGMNFGYGYDRILSSFADPTSTVHVGLPREIPVKDIDALKYDENEFNEVLWLTKQELKDLKAKLEVEQSELSFETWSALLVDSF
jgi:predicted NUDIX family phosphoesterase